MAQKVCPVVFRMSNGAVELLAFKHPSAGNQFVKGSIEDGELAPQAALRELREESGIIARHPFRDLGQAPIGTPPTLWHFFAVEAEDLPRRWTHQTHDDCGHVFSFFWHPLTDDLGEDWHPIYCEALKVIRRLLSV